MKHKEKDPKHQHRPDLQVFDYEDGIPHKRGCKVCGGSGLCRKCHGLRCIDCNYTGICLSCQVDK